MCVYFVFALVKGYLECRVSQLWILLRSRTASLSGIFVCMDEAAWVSGVLFFQFPIILSHLYSCYIFMV